MGGEHEMERFRTERLVARSWQIEDLPLAMELWGDPAVTALIDSRGKLTKAQVNERLCAEIERERSSGVQYWALFDHRNGNFVGCGGLRPWVYTPNEADFEVGVHLVKRYWGKGFGNGSCPRRAQICVGRVTAVESLCRASPGQSCFGVGPKEARIRIHRKCVLRAHRLDASVLHLHGART